MTLEQIQQVIERTLEALRDFVDTALPPEPQLRPIPVPVRRPQGRRR